MGSHCLFHCCRLASACIAFGASAWGLVAAAPEFYLIERFLKAGVLVHFDVEPSRTYELQSTTNLSAAMGIPSGSTNAWRTIYRIDASPFPQHYILPDYFTNTTALVFYRLKISP